MSEPAIGSKVAEGGLPYGVFSRPGERRRVGVRVVDTVLDLAAVARTVGSRDTEIYEHPSINALMALGPDRWPDVHAWVRSLVADLEQERRFDEYAIPLDEVALHLPFEVGDYVDFYASEHHASNVGKIFRPDSPALPQSWKHLPIGYHGRAGTVVVSGTDVVRPHGQRRGPSGLPDFGPTGKLDIECEVGFVVGQPSTLGQPVPLSAARQYIFGVVLVNDWSARDIQAFEYVPLGPFLGKSFATSVSAWVLPLEALAPAEIALPGQDPPVQSYLSGDGSEVFGLDLQLRIEVNGHVVAEPHYRDMYWSPSQMLAHMTVNGASLRVGDLFASGTVSGPSSDSLGSLLELTWNGTSPVSFPNGERRGFLADGDVVTMSGWAPGAAGGPVRLGEVTGRVIGTDTGLEKSRNA
jgi:fumarylacetoacetase